MRIIWQSREKLGTHSVTETIRIIALDEMVKNIVIFHQKYAEILGRGAEPYFKNIMFGVVVAIVGMW